MKREKEAAFIVLFGQFVRCLFDVAQSRASFSIFCDAIDRSPRTQFLETDEVEQLGEGWGAPAPVADAAGDAEDDVF